MNQNGKSMKNLACIIYSLLFLTSCSSILSIEKRKYRDGYYVEQKHFYSNNSDKPERCKSSPAETKDLIPFEAIANTNKDGSELRSISAEKANEYTIVSSIKHSIFFTDTIPDKKKKHNSPKKFDETKDATQDHRKLSPFVIIGLVFGIIALVFSFSSSIILSIPFAAAGTLLSLIGLDTINKHPEKREGKPFGIAAIGICLASLILFLLAWSIAV